MNPRTRPPDSQPVTIPGYEVLDTLGTGGFSVVLSRPPAVDAP